jgi:CubicO group peptidase (beta-lactamase class C family)
MQPSKKMFSLLSFLLLTGFLIADTSNGLAPEVTDLNAEDVSYSLEKKIPYLKTAFVDFVPNDLDDFIPVGTLDSDSVNKEAIESFLQEIADEKHGNTDSFLISHKNHLLVESYFKRGRINYPHYQMSITKSYTALAIGRAIKLGYMDMEDLNKPIVHFLKDLDLSSIASGTKEITLHQAMHMKSGIRIDKKISKELMKDPESLKKQGQIQAYLQYTQPIKSSEVTFKYQGADPSIAMQILEVKVPGSAEDFIRDELLKPMGITNYSWQEDVSGLPKSAAGSSICSRDMLKFGMLMMNKGVFNDQPLIDPEFIEIATSALDKNPNRTYGYFWWGHEVKVGSKTYLCTSGRGAGGQLILIFPQLELILVTTAHNKGMGQMLKLAGQRVIPALFGKI